MTSETNVPLHVGIIMDGNRRWAKAHNLPVLRGHSKGEKVLHQVARHAFSRGVKFLTVFAFSTENWQRPGVEVSYLMRSAVLFSKKHINELIEENIRLVFLGSLEGLDKKVLNAFEKAEQKTSKNTRATLAVCFNYSGTQEIKEAVARLIKTGIKENELTDEDIQENLYHPEIPPLDMIIRTSGEKRLSNFMLWRSTYSELIFRSEMWPDFSTKIFDECLIEYSKRKRRFGV